MRVLVCGGVKSDNIARAITKTFESSGVSFVVEPYIGNVLDMFQRGEYFDRALMIEQSWTNDGEDISEWSWRQKLNQFALGMNDRGEDTALVWLTTSQEKASMVSEEILPISRNSIIVVKQPPYTINFFSFIIAGDFDKFPSDIVYNPMSLEPELEEFTGGNSGEFDGPHQEFNPDFENITEDKFGNNDANGLPVNTGENRFGDDDDPFGDSEFPGLEDLDPSEFDNFDPEFDTADFGKGDNGFGDPDNAQGNRGNFSTPEFNTPFDTNTFDNVGDDGFGDPNLGSGSDASWGAPTTPKFEQPRQFETPEFDAPKTFDTPTFDDPSFGGNSPDNGFENAGFGDVGDNGENDDFGPSHDIGDQNWNNPNDGFNYDDNRNHQNNGNNWGNPQPQNNQQWGNNQEQFNGERSGQIPQYPGRDNGFDNYNDPVNNEPVDQNPSYGGAEYGGAAYEQNPGYQNNQGYQENPGYQNNQNPAYGGNDYQENPGYDQYYPNQTNDNDMFDPSQYQENGGYENDGEEEVVRHQTPKVAHRVTLNDKQIKATIDTFATRGTSIVVTGCGGCGTSTIALNIANVLCNMKYEVLLVDMDTKHKTQSYISKDNYDSVNDDAAPVMSAVNNQSSGINTHISIVRPGFHLLTMGMSSDSKTAKEAFQKEKISRFVNLAKSSHNFVIYDVPFDDLTDHLKDVLFNADCLVVTVDASNWGITKTMLDFCNIDNDDVSETLFKRGQLLFNRHRGMKKVLGRKVKTAVDITVAMDTKVKNLLCDDPGLYFQNMNICGFLNEDPAFESGWFESGQYSDTRNGSMLFSDLITHILMMN